MGEHERSPASRSARCATAWRARPGLEIWGPYEQHDEIRDAILEAGARVRPRAVRLARLPVEHARVGLDPLAAAGDLHRRGAARLPRVAARRRLRGDQRARRQLRLRRHRGLLPQPVGARLRPVRQVRPRLHRPRRAREDRPGDPAQEGHARLERRGHRRRSSPRCSTATAPATSSSTCRSRTTARRTTTRWSTPNGNRRRAVDVHRLQRQRAARRCRSRRSTPTSRSAPRCSVVWGEPDGGTRKTTRRAARAARGPRGRQPRPVLGDRADRVRGGLAHGRGALGSGRTIPSERRQRR